MMEQENTNPPPPVLPPSPDGETSAPAPDGAEPDKPQTNAVTVMRSAELEPLNKAELTLFCEQRSLSTKGTKEALIDRLLIWQEQEDQNARLAEAQASAPLPVVYTPEVFVDPDYNERKGTLSISAEELVLVCAAIHSPRKRVETYSFVAEAISATEVVFSRPVGGDQGQHRYVITLPPRVTVKAEPR